MTKTKEKVKTKSPKDYHYRFRDKLQVTFTFRTLQACTHCEQGWRFVVGNCVLCGRGPAPGDFNNYTYPAKPEEIGPRLQKLMMQELVAMFEPKVTVERVAAPNMCPMGTPIADITVEVQSNLKTVEAK